jgi:hypothetical protein
VQVFRTAPLFRTCGSASIAPRPAGAACWPHPIGPESNRCVRLDLRVVALAFAADSSTLHSAVELVKKREAATPEPAAAKAASKRRIVSDDEDNAPEVKPKKKPTAAPKPAAPVKPTAAPKPAAPVKPTAAAPKPAAAPKKQADLLSMLKPANKTGPAQAAAKWEPPVQVVTDEELPLLERLKRMGAAAPPKPAAAERNGVPRLGAAPKARAPRATASKSKKHVVSDDEDYSDDEDDSEDEVSSRAHGSPSCRVPIPML